MRFYLRGCAGNQPRVNGVGILTPTQGSVWYQDFVSDSNGNISGTLYSTRDVTGNSGGEIECGGSTTAVWYGMVIISGGKTGPEVPIVAKNTATIDVSNVTPITTNPIVTSPTGDTTYARIDAGNQPFTGNIQAPNVTATSQLKSTVATGTAPLAITSTTQVSNLNVSFLVGSTWVSPGAIGSSTPNTGAFTTLSTTGNATVGGTLGVTGAVTAPTYISSAASHAAVGTIRLAPTDAINIRNATNSGDLNGLSHDGLSDNLIVLGAPPGISIPGGISAVGGVSTANGGGGIFTLGNGFGVPLFVGATFQRSETAADTNVLTFTPPATIGTYRLHLNISISAANAATLGWTATWKDANGTSQAPTNLPICISSAGTCGATTGALSSTVTASGDYYVDTDATGTNIVIKLTFSGTSFTAKITATVERLI